MLLETSIHSLCVFALYWTMKKFTGHAPPSHVFKCKATAVEFTLKRASRFGGFGAEKKLYVLTS